MSLPLRKAINTQTHFHRSSPASFCQIHFPMFTCMGIISYEYSHFIYSLVSKEHCMQIPLLYPKYNACYQSLHMVSQYLGLPTHPSLLPHHLLLLKNIVCVHYSMMIIQLLTSAGTTGLPLSSFFHAMVQILIALMTVVYLYQK